MNSCRYHLSGNVGFEKRQGKKHLACQTIICQQKTAAALLLAAAPKLLSLIT